jgi:hypothetical protein
LKNGRNGRNGRKVENFKTPNKNKNKKLLVSPFSPLSPRFLKVSLMRD